VGCGLVDSALALVQAATPRGAKRREVTIGGRRALTVDIHNHILVPEVANLVKGYQQAEGYRNQLASALGPNSLMEDALRLFQNVDARLARMDAEGLDMQAVSINPFWYFAERDLARQIIQIQNEKIAELCAAHPDRFVGLATVALQHPEMAAEQLEVGIRKYGMRGCSISSNVEGEDLSSAKFHPFWAKAEELGTLVFIHPVSFPGGRRFKGNGGFGTVLGNPFETTVALSHLIWDGTLDRYPGLKICAAHGGGYLPFYNGRSDACLKTFPEECKPVKKLPSEYLKQLYYDSIVFTPEAMRYLVSTVGADRIVLGTDFPTYWNTQGVDHVLNTPGLSDDDKRAILGGTVAHLLRINV
jgi:aminocarboxymuconate-semialdehyde decarboxylase